VSIPLLHQGRAIGAIGISPRTAWHYKLAKELRALRERGVLIIGSGNIVHNLRRLSRQSADSGFDWAVEFDARIKELIDKGDHQGVVDYHRLGPAARLSVPTNEHFLPLLYVLALKDDTDTVTYFNDRLLMGGVSMRSLLIGGDARSAAAERTAAPACEALGRRPGHCVGSPRSRSHRRPRSPSRSARRPTVSSFPRS
jgi:hypothetical protein